MKKKKKRRIVEEISAKVCGRGVEMRVNKMNREPRSLHAWPTTHHPPSTIQQPPTTHHPQVEQRIRSDLTGVKPRDHGVVKAVWPDRDEVVLVGNGLDT